MAHHKFSVADWLNMGNDGLPKPDDVLLWMRDSNFPDFYVLLVLLEEQTFSVLTAEIGRCWAISFECIAVVRTSGFFNWTWLRYIRVLLSQIRLSVVCNVRAPYSRG